MDALIHAIMLVAAYGQYDKAAKAASKGNSKRKIAEMERTFAVYITVRDSVVSIYKETT